MRISSKKTSNAISVYLSPRAKKVLDKYYENSDFGSLSRTVEEMILSYDRIYTLLLSSLATNTVEGFFSTPSSILATFFLMIGALNLSDGSPYEQIVRAELEKVVVKSMQRVRSSSQ